jgi:hypothetical protein
MLVLLQNNQVKSPSSTYLVDFLCVDESAPVFSSVADPQDACVFGPPGFLSGSVSQK